MLLVLPAAPAEAWGPGYGGPSKIRAWSLGVTNALQGGTCVITAGAGVQEFGKNHVTRLKLKFELRAPDDTSSFLRTYGGAGYFYSSVFPDDKVNHYGEATATMYVKAGGKFSVWAVLVGERGWRPDYKTRILLGPAGCDAQQDLYNQLGGSPDDVTFSS